MVLKKNKNKDSVVLRGFAVKINPWGFFLIFVGLFLFLLFFGLCESKWFEVDEIQCYLVGLKFYTTHAWPYFGPDVNGIESSFQSQIPGALEGLLVGLPLFLLPIPEAPFILINLMTAAGAALLAWYIQKRIPRMSFYWLFLLVCVTPWVLQKCTYVINPAFNFLPSVLFFIGFMETLPAFSMRFLPTSWCNAFMGFSLFWVMQFHFSYVYFVPLAAYGLFIQMKKSKKASPLLYFIAGALPMLALIVPTFLKYGLMRSDVASGFAVPFNWFNVREWLTILARYLALPCFEIPRFIGTSTVERVSFLKDHPWLSVPAVLLWVSGILQVLFLLACWFKGPHALPKGKWLGNSVFVLLLVGLWFNNSLYPNQRILAIVLAIAAKVYLEYRPISWFKKYHPLPAWKELKLFHLLAYLMIWASFWFTIKGANSHIYLVFFPWLMLYACYCYSLFADKPAWRTTAKVFLVLALYFHLGHALAKKPLESVWVHRDQVVRAIQEKNYHIMGERRPGSWY